MNIVNIFLLIIAIATFILSFFISIKQKRSPLNLSFSILVALAGLWPLSIALFREANNLSSALFWDRIIYICAIFIAPAILAFVHVFTENKFKFKLWRVLAYISPIIVLIPFLFLPGFWIKNIILTKSGNKVELGPVYPVWIVWFITYMAWAFIILLNKYRKSSGLLKMQLRYIFLSFALPAIGSLPFNVIAPLFGYYTLIWTGPIFITAMIAVIAYAILRYRLMDIRLVIRSLSIFILALLIAVSITLFSVWCMAYLMHYKPNPILMIGGGFAVAASILIFIPLRSALQKLADKIFFQKIVSAQEALKRISNELTTIIDFDKLTILILETIQRTLGTNKIALILKNNIQKEDLKIYKLFGFKERVIQTFLTDQIILKNINLLRQPIFLEELKSKKDITFKKLQKRIEKTKISLILPLKVQNNLYGLIILGKKNSGETYTKEDLDLLENLSSQASLAIENAQLYQQINKLNKKLDQKVQVQTAQIEQLSHEREKFIEVASHQLRTPISGAASFISSFVDGTLENESSEERKKDYKMIYQSFYKLQNTVNQILDALAVQKIGGLKLANKKLYDLEAELKSMLTSATSTIKMEAEAKNIHFEIKKIPAKLPPLWVDPYYFNGVLKSLIDNSIKYSFSEKEVVEGKYQTKKTVFLLLMQGQVKALLRQISSISQITQDSHLEKQILSALKNLPEYQKIFLLLIQDYGIGITHKELVKLQKFTPFYRTDQAKLIYTDGSGISFYLADNIIRAHQGELHLYSAGKEKGATVWFYVKGE